MASRVCHYTDNSAGQPRSAAAHRTRLRTHMHTRTRAHIRTTTLDNCSTCMNFNILLCFTLHKLNNVPHFNEETYIWVKRWITRAPFFLHTSGRFHTQWDASTRNGTLPHAMQRFHTQCNAAGGPNGNTRGHGHAPEKRVLAKHLRINKNTN